ncbi:hypothetical protein MP477_20610 [Chryseobacterium sp. WG23]|uniref:hypothetical protein n=1 Tax=Chryseobacterium sp. WG23 TaxID=2926910 RepID=UPI00211E3984|nr:hypothetical protein [Chryseobacterium sp. WG23]MCQ9637358.1 hypothetical protein [Chryseobacterium sp. WG23]
MKKIVFILGLACYSCGDKYEGQIIYKTTIPPYMISNIAKSDIDIEADTDRQAKIQFVTRATIYNNVSPYIQSEFITGSLLKNKRGISYLLDQNTIDSINISIKRITAHRNGYFNPYKQK